jgi:hypothetical protein
MNFLSQTSAEIRRIHKNFTKEITVTNYTWDESGGTNEYADGDWTTSVSTVEASLFLPEDVEYENDPSGDKASHDVTIYVAPDDIDLSIGLGDETRATEFTDGQGRRYKAIGFHDESSLYRVQCREVE